MFGKLANDVTSELKLPKDSRANLNIYLGEIDWVAFHALVPPLSITSPSPSLLRFSVTWPSSHRKAWSAAPSSPRCSVPASS